MGGKTDCTGICTASESAKSSHIPVYEEFFTTVMTSAWKASSDFSVGATEVQTATSKTCKHTHAHTHTHTHINTDTCKHTHTHNNNNNNNNNNNITLRTYTTFSQCNASF
jgi:ABC-type nickel/cobalt efflux system permease component RcnA